MPVTLQTMQELNNKLQELRSFGSRSSGISSYSYYRPSYSYSGGYHVYIGGGYHYGYYGGGGHMSTGAAIGVIVFILVLFCLIGICKANGSDEEGEIVTVTQTDNVD